MSETKKNIDYWLACSGGVDSVVLVRLFKELKKNFGILHCNFELRGDDSGKDESFVRKLADEMEVPLQIKTFNVKSYINENGGNTQLAARNLRYNWFEEIKEESQSKIVLGHQKDDQIETFFLQLRRGGMLKGLSCMPFIMNDYVRPLLNYSKEEIYDLARVNKWKWREDSSNAKNNYKRNIYRNKWIPFFQKNNLELDNIVDLIADFQTILNYTERYLEQSFDFESDVNISFLTWGTMPKWMKHESLRMFNVSKISAFEVERLKKSQKGKYLFDSNTKIWNEGDHFKFQKISKSVKTEFELEVKIIDNEKVKLESGYLYIDAEKVSSVMSARRWQNIDVFQPLGMKGSKTISKFLRDRKVESSLKGEIPILVDDNDRVLGVFGFCPDEKFKVNSSVKVIYKIKLKC